MENEKLALFDFLFQILCQSTKDLFIWESAFYHLINLPFDAEVAEKFLNGF